MTEGKIAVCPQCGKKFKLKEGFSAASFSCTGCGATVWVEGKPPAPASGRKASPAARKGRGGARRGGRRAAPTRGRRGAQHDEGDEEQEGRGRYSSRKQNNSTNVIIAIVGVVILAAIGVFFITSDKGGEKEQQAFKQPGAPEGVLGSEDNPIDPAPNSGIPNDAQTPTPGEGTPTPTEGGGTPGEGQPSEEGVETIGEKAPTEATKSLGGDKKKTTKKGGIRKSKYDPPVDIPHLEDTPPELREKIDNYITSMFDPWAGRDSTDAKYELINIGKPAFPRILAKMAAVRDTITDVDNDDERLIESSLKLADEALREMDGYLTSHTKPVLRPGSEKKYIAYICRLHYKRWVTVLKDMPAMPGPYDPSGDYGESPEEMD
jgi:hypothetical protein